SSDLDCAAANCCHWALPWIYRMRPRRRLETSATRSAASVGKSRAAVLSQAGAPLSWTIERADMLFVCEGVRKAAASKRQPQRAERVMCTERAEALFLRGTTK